MTDVELEGHSQLVGNGGVFEGGGLNVSQFGNSTLNDRDVSSQANQSIAPTQSQ